MVRVETPLPFICASCEAEIKGMPVFHVGVPFCCAGCVAGGPCTCSYDEAADGGRRATAPRHALPVLPLDVPDEPGLPATARIVVAPTVTVEPDRSLAHDRTRVVVARG